jgi:hypothetical protein
MSGVWGTAEAMPFSEATLAQASASGASQIVQLPCGTYVAGFNADTGPVTPQSVTAYQLLMALNNAGRYTDLMTYVNSQSAPVQIAFNQSINFNRTNPMVLAAAAALGMSSAQTDSLFVSASHLSAIP